MDHPYNRNATPVDSINTYQIADAEEKRSLFTSTRLSNFEVAIDSKVELWNERAPQKQVLYQNAKNLITSSSVGKFSGAVYKQNFKSSFSSLKRKTKKPLILPNILKSNMHQQDLMVQQMNQQRV